MASTSSSGFRDRNVSTSSYEYDSLSELDRIQKEGRGDISEMIKVLERRRVGRSFQRGSATRAINQGV